MSEESSIMSDNTAIEVILARLEGKVDLVNSKLQTYDRDQTAIRTRVHDLSNEIHIITGLGLPDRIRVADSCRADHDARITALENLEQQRQGAANLVRVVWTLITFLGIGGIAALIKVFGG